MMANKGSQFERVLCKQFSLWWTGGKRDDVFWRTSGSGARASVRGRAKKQTAGQHGDIAATDPIGKPLIDALTIEIKRGYATKTIADLLDREETAAQQKWELWHQQVYDSWQHSGSFAWMMICKRDQRQPIVFFPDYLFTALDDLGCLFRRPLLQFRAEVRHVRKKQKTPVREVIMGTTLKQWLEVVSPEIIKQVSEM